MIARNENSLAANVQFGHGQGWSFTPLSGKRPTLPAWQKRPRETLDEALEWAAKGNVGLRCGQVSRVVVIDVDEGGDISALDLPATVTVNTGRNGIHLYYLCEVPLGNSSGKLGPHIDVKADGGQVVFPGSIHPDTGQRYEWAEGLEPWVVSLAPLPQHVIDLLIEPAGHTAKGERPRRQRPCKIERYASMALKLELKAVADAVEGTRNDTLNSAAFSLGTLIGAGHLDRGEAERGLREAALAVGLEPGETDATIRSGIESGMQQPRKIELRSRPNESEAPIPAADRDDGEYILTPGPHVDGDGVYTEQASNDFADQVLARLPAGAVYRKDFLPGEILGTPGKRRWLELTDNRMILIADSHCKLGKWVKSRANDEQVMIYQPCSKQNASIVLAHARQSPIVRELALMVSYPIYGPGFVRVEPGWRDGLFFDEPDDLRGLVPERDYEVIHNVLHDLVVDFPFKTAADRENFFGLMLTPIVAPALESNRPMHLINSPLERTGKTKLAEEVFGGVILGRQTPAMQLTDRDEERDKRVIGLLLTGETLMHLDNLPPWIDSASLASLLTATTYSGRLLGQSRILNLANNLTIVGSGNNIQASGEIAKRVVPILLQPRSAHPEQRQDFQHPDIRSFVRERRQTVLECLLGLIENWIEAGKPKHPRRLGGFEAWSETIGGILQVNGLNAWRTNEAAWQKQASPKEAELEAFIDLWHREFNRAEVSPKQLLALAQDNELFGDLLANKKTPQSAATTFGRFLRRHTDAPVGQWFIRQSASGNNSSYRLEAIQ